MKYHNMQLIAVCLVVLCWFGAVQASCKVDEIPTMENFDMTKVHMYIVSSYIYIDNYIIDLAWNHAR